MRIKPSVIYLAALIFAAASPFLSAAALAEGKPKPNTARQEKAKPEAAKPEAAQPSDNGKGATDSSEDPEADQMGGEDMGSQD